MWYLLVKRRKGDDSFIGGIWSEEADETLRQEDKKEGKSGLGSQRKRALLTEDKGAEESRPKKRGEGKETVPFKILKIG